MLKSTMESANKEEEEGKWILWNLKGAVRKGFPVNVATVITFLDSAFKTTFILSTN